jgi:hypothetical protein
MNALFLKLLGRYNEDIANYAISTRDLAPARHVRSSTSGVDGSLASSTPIWSERIGTVVDHPLQYLHATTTP